MSGDESSLAQDERRQHERSRLIIDVYFNGQDLTGVAGTKDISLGGLYMNTKTEIPEGSLLTLRIPVAGRDIVCNAEVIYSNPGRGVGVRFHGMSELDREVLVEGLASAEGQV
jgi:hypothetical protein